jgi:uncharacterized membrane protein
MIPAAPEHSLKTFYTTLGAALLFTLYTSSSLPDVVASHFNSAGAATGFLPRRAYTVLATLMLLLPALLLVQLPRQTLRKPNARINLPNARYWLAPQRREQTVAIITRSCAQLAQLLVIFLCYAHWLLVHANHTVPPTLSSTWLIGGLVVFLGLTVAGSGRLIARFYSIEE